VGIGVSSRLVSMKIYKSRLVPTIFVLVGIGVSSRLVPTNICNSRLVPTKNYKEKFCGFLLKGFPHKSCVPCFAVNRYHM
jgi:hypothetical protein